MSGKIPDGDIEVTSLPRGWYWKYTDDKFKQVKYHREGSSDLTSDHPYLGALPKDWILRRHTNRDGEEELEYYNLSTQSHTRWNPRASNEAIQAQLQNLPAHARTSGQIYKPDGTKKFSLEEFQRAPIGQRNIRGEYYEVKKFTGGAMNAGVFAVVLKEQLSNFHVEKRFSSNADLVIARFAKKEIELLHRFRHDALSMFTAAFIEPGFFPPDEFTLGSGHASVFVELCDLGDLSDMIQTFARRRQQDASTPQIPEGFIWHAFIACCDGLAYMQGGRSFLHTTNYEPKPGWAPVLHRDIKPENILLSSRRTLGSTKYPYCIISDFGLACEDDGSEPYQANGLVCGTPNFFAPELCWPVGVPRVDNRLASRHSFKSDLWALCACMYNLTCTEASRLRASSAHGWHDGRTERSAWLLGQESFLLPLPGLGKVYSRELAKALKVGMDWDVGRRPDAIGMMRYLNKVKLEKYRNEGKDALPGWALRKHDYHAEAATGPDTGWATYEQRHPEKIRGLRY